MNCISRKRGALVLGVACTAFTFGIAPAAAQNAGGVGNGVGGSACSCMDASTLNQIYANELQMNPAQNASRHCAIAPTFLDLEQSVISTRNQTIATDQSFAQGVVNSEPKVTVNSQFLVYIDSNPNKPMGSCEIKTIRNAATTRDVKVSITHQEASACMAEIQASRTWQELCVGDVLKSQ